MEYRALVLILYCAIVCAAVEQKLYGGVKYEMGGKEDQENIKNLMSKLSTQDDSESGDGEGSGKSTDDTESSGSGSGEGMDNNDSNVPSIIVITTEKPKKTVTKEKIKSKASSTVMVINNGDTTEKPRKKTTTKENNDPLDAKKPTVDPRNDVRRATIDDGGSNDNDVETGVNFTVGIIIGVVVGAILAILVIVFLVYRLRKKDEGSYSLDEPSSQAFIRDEKSNPGQGKEYFA